MSENNLPNEGMNNEIENEETTENVEETFENEETIADMPTTADAPEDAEAPAEAKSSAVIGAIEAEAPKAASNYKVSAIVAWILVVLLAAVDIGYYMTNIYNKYNHMGYLDVNGYTIGEVVAGMGMEFDEFKDMYGLPKDMRKDTYMNAAQSLIPVSKMAELNGKDLDSLREMYNFSEEITENSTWGEAIDSMSLKDYVGEDQFEEFKTKYELGDDITLDTKCGDIRKDIEKKQVAEREAAEAAASASASPSASAEASPEATADASAEPSASADASAEPSAEAAK